MGHENDGLGRVLFNLGEEVITLPLECLVAHGENLVKYKDVALSLDGHGESKTYLHARGIVLEFLVHEFFQLGELHDVVIHRINFRTSKAKQGTIQIHVLTTGKLRIETDTKLNERHQLTRNRNRALFRSVNLGNDLQ